MGLTNIQELILWYNDLQFLVYLTIFVGSI